MKKHLNVWGVQIYSNFIVTLPVSIGTLWSYIVSKEDLKQHLNFLGWGVYYNPDQSVETLIDEISLNGKPDILLVSLYIWNRNRSNKLVKKAKEKWPDLKVIVGGNEVPQDTYRFERFVKENPGYDYYVNSEGEIALEMVLRKILSEQSIFQSPYFDDCFYEIGNSKIVKIPQRKRYLDHKNFLDYPSACELGLYDELIKKLPSVDIQGIIETNRGCPYSCTFCDWGLEEKLRKFSMQRIKKEIDWYVDNVNEIMIADANFGIKSRDYEIASYIVHRVNNSPKSKLHTVAITFAKNNKERVLDIAELLETNDLTRFGATFSLQSMNQNTLETIKRDNMSITDNFDWIADNFIKKQIPYYHELIIGLPQETKKSFLTGMSRLLEYNPQTINVWKLGWLENNEISLKNHSEQFGLKWKKVEQGPFTDFEDEREFSYIIKETNTMSEKEMKEVTEIKDLIEIFWLGKTIFYVGRYLQNQLDIPACDIICDLNDYIKDQKESTFWKQFLLSNRSENDKKLIKWHDYNHKQKFNKYTNAWLYIHGDTERRETFYKEILQFIDLKYGSITCPEIMHDLVKFNKNILVSCASPESLHHEYCTDYSWIEFFNTGKLKRSATDYTLKKTTAGNNKTQVNAENFQKTKYFIAGGHEFIFNKKNAFQYDYVETNSEKKYRIKNGIFYRHH